MVYRLDKDDIWFPDPRRGEEDGLFAVGGDLSVRRLLLAYSYGIFPWFSFRDWPYPAWHCPMQRFVIFASATPSSSGVFETPFTLKDIAILHLRL